MSSHCNHNRKNNIYISNETFPIANCRNRIPATAGVLGRVPHVIDDIIPPVMWAIYLPITHELTDVPITVVQVLFLLGNHEPDACQPMSD